MRAEFPQPAAQVLQRRHRVGHPRGSVQLEQRRDEVARGQMFPRDPAGVKGGVGQRNRANTSPSSSTTTRAAARARSNGFCPSGSRCKAPGVARRGRPAGAVAIADAPHRIGAPPRAFVGPLAGDVGEGGKFANVLGRDDLVIDPCGGDYPERAKPCRLIGGGRAVSSGVQLGDGADQ